MTSDGTTPPSDPARPEPTRPDLGRPDLDRPDLDRLALLDADAAAGDPRAAEWVARLRAPGAEPRAVAILTALATTRAQLAALPVPPRPADLTDRCSAALRVAAGSAGHDPGEHLDPAASASTTGHRTDDTATRSTGGRHTREDTATPSTTEHRIPDDTTTQSTTGHHTSDDTITPSTSGRRIPEDTTTQSTAGHHTPDDTTSEPGAPHAVGPGGSTIEPPAGGRRTAGSERPASDRTPWMLDRPEHRQPDHQPGDQPRHQPPGHQPPDQPRDHQPAGADPTHHTVAPRTRPHAGPQPHLRRQPHAGRRPHLPDRPAPRRPPRTAARPTPPPVPRRAPLAAAALLIGLLAALLAGPLTTSPADPHPSPPPRSERSDRIDLVTAGRSAIGATDLGPFADPVRRAGCLRALGVLDLDPDTPPLGGRRVELARGPAVLLVFPTGELGVFDVVLVDPACGPAGGTLLGTARIGR